MARRVGPRKQALQPGRGQRAWSDSVADVGYVVAEGVLSVGEVERLRAAFPPAPAGSTLHVDIDDPTPDGAAWNQLSQHHAIRPLLVDLLGDGDLDVTVHGRDPGAGAGGQGLHADLPPGRIHDVEAITLLWMLDEFDPGNGATRVVPRSHRGASAVPRHLAQPGTVHPDEVVVTGRPGDVLILDAHLWHSGRSNSSGARRRAAQMTVARTQPRAAR